MSGNPIIMDEEEVKSAPRGIARLSDAETAADIGRMVEPESCSSSTEESNISSTNFHTRYENLSKGNLAPYSQIFSDAHYSNRCSSFPGLL